MTTTVPTVVNSHPVRTLAKHLAVRVAAVVVVTLIADAIVNKIESK